MDNKEKKSEVKQSFYKRIISFLIPYKHIFLLSFLLNLLFSFLTAVTFPLFKFVLDLVFQNKIGIQEVPTGDFLESIKVHFYNFITYLINVNGDIKATLLNFGILTIFLFVIKNIVKYYANYVSGVLQERLIKSIRDKVFAKLSGISLDYFSRSRQGNIISILTNDVAVLNNTTIINSLNVLREIIQVIINIGFLLSISPYLTLIAFSASIFTVLILRLARKYLQRYAKRMQQYMADFTSTLQETISGIKVIQAYNSEAKANAKFFDDTEKYVKAAIKHKNMTSVVPGLSEIFAIFALCIVLVVGGGLVIDSQIASSDLIVFILLLFGTMGPVNSIVNSIAGFQRGYVAADRVFSVLDAKSNIYSGKVPIKGFEDSIEISNVTFAYENDIVINDISFQINKGEKIAFVGASGSGKSTILDLIVRFYDATTGIIKFDSLNIKDYDLAQYRKLFSIVSQDTVLFNDTIANNIRYGKENATNEEVVNALKTAYCWDFISKLPEGINSNVGDRGSTLSGGERQRLAIARALVRDPQILVFDEATSALDSESEKIVQDAINKSLENRTAIIVAHRLATIIDCDRIYVFSNGRIVESGTHQELLSLNGVYKNLYNIQFNGN